MGPIALVAERTATNLATRLGSRYASVRIRRNSCRDSPFATILVIRPPEPQPQCDLHFMTNSTLLPSNPDPTV
jgi:hypothetical protein